MNKIDVMVVSLCCDDKQYEYVLNTRKSKHVDPAQKFFRNIIYGLRDNCIVNTVTCVSIVPVSKSSHIQKVWTERHFFQEGVEFYSAPFINGLISRYITQSVSTAKFIEEWIKHSSYDKIIYIDTMNAAHIIKRLHKIGRKYSIPIIGVVTDLPLQWLKMKKVKGLNIRRMFYTVFNFYSEQMLKYIDGYVWLTEQMNDLKNNKNRPYCIVEGCSDYSNELKKTNLELPKEFVLYAGGIYSIFQIEKLCDAFLLSNVNADLLLFGDGPEVTKIKEKYRNNKVKYMGVLSSQEIRWVEGKAKLLINPRPTSDEYTKYSFPSKTLEYMESGTPVLTTRLAGIPKEYDKFLLWIDDESVYGMRDAINKIFNTKEKELIAFGKRAQIFVRTQKNAVVQAKKMIDLALIVKEGMDYNA